MKKTLLLFFSVCITGAYAQEDTPPLSFDYDSAGNQTLSALVCINCPEAPAAKQSLAQLTYYPNPVAQELHLTWEAMETGRVSAVTLYTLNGKQLATLKNLTLQTQLSLPFGSYPAGIYLVEVLSSDGATKSFKILKK